MGDNLKLEDVLNARNIFCIFTGEGNFFLCLDEWMCPAEYKTWYKFSINPFDIDFLKFVYIGRGIFKEDGTGSRLGIDCVIKYFNINKKHQKISNLLNETFFNGGYVTNAISKYNSKYNTNYSPSKIYALRSKITNAIKTWLSRLYKQYNFFDNSIEYIKEYFENWVMIVDQIQSMVDNNKSIDNIYDFIDKYNIRDTKTFLKLWKSMVLTGKVDIYKFEKDISESFYRTLLYSTKNYDYLWLKKKGVL